MRLTLALVAVCIAALMAYDLHWVSDVETGRRLMVGHGPAGQRSAIARFERAARHQPGTEALLSEAELDLYTRRPRSAIAPLGRAVAIEPRNAAAWKLLADAAASVDPALAQRAAARFTNLVARVPRKQ